MPRRNDSSPSEALIDAQPRLQQLKNEAIYVLETALRDKQIKTHTVTGRLKEVASAVEKMTRKGYVDPLVDIEDLVGIRVVCLFLDDLQTLREVIYESFKVLGESNSVDGSDPSTFGYKSHHYICAVRDDYTGPRYDGLKDLKVEIQCRTIAMDAWASISHYLAYKSASSVPDDLQRDFAALSGLFYVADRHFQHFSETSKTVEEKALRLQESGSDDADAVALDRASVTGLFYRIYRDRDRADQASISQFVEEAKLVGFTTIGGLRTALLEHYDSALKLEEESPPFDPQSNERTQYLDVGLARATLDYAYPEYSPDMRALRSNVDED